MIKNSILHSTFIHLLGIGVIKEKILWDKGIKSWGDLENYNKQLNLFTDDENETNILYESYKALENRDVNFFANRLPKSDYYRLILSFPFDTIFLDIETTGLSRYYDKITVIGWCISNNYNVFITGDSDEKLKNAINNSKTIVTFNGSLFDIPFIKNEFPDIETPICHLDLRFFSRRFGISGGQKKIENILGFKRPKKIRETKGSEAPILWYKYKNGDKSALKQLIEYNYYDIEGMKYILDALIDKMSLRNKIPLNDISIPKFYEFKRKVFNFNGEINDYKGISGPLINLDRITYLSNQKYIRIVGIDLCGSSKRASGMCYLQYNNATTEKLNTDQEIIERSIKFKPDLISIDSPLSIPFGRKYFTDDDPTRKEFGIMRYCERQLKKRGINVYPCLLPSMQKLTERGIKLASYFRSIGIPVIESYPGAVQDIINIPRKKASMEYLKKGLIDFGIKGKYIRQKVSHDELDAITSAIVGHFFWCGKFEALGNYDENYLIIPDLKKDVSIWLNRKVIGLSGPTATGKTTAGKLLESKGFSYGRYSMVINNLHKIENGDLNRSTLQDLGNKINTEKGQRWLGKKLISMFSEEENVVIDGLRFLEDYTFLKETFGPAFTLIYIDTPSDIRCERYINMGKKKEDFINAEHHNVERDVEKLLDKANIKIDNDKSIVDFKEKILEIIKQ